MGRKSKKQKELDAKTSEVMVMSPQLLEEHKQLLDTNIKYSLEVDPENKYDMSDTQKKFLEYYVNYKSIPFAADLAGIDEETARGYFVAYSSQEEIKRINMAMYHRQFSKKMLTLSELGGYLSSLLTDENVPLADRLKPTDKLRVVDMIVSLHRTMAEAVIDPGKVVTKDIETDIKNLSVDAIKNLLSTNDEHKKDDAIGKINEDNHLTDEEIAFMKSLPLSELLKLVEQASKK